MTIDYDAFGLPSTKQHERSWLQELDEEPEASETLEEATETPAEAPAEAAAETVEEAPAEVPEASAEGAEAEVETATEPSMILGKYRDQAALEQGYINLQSLQTRTAQRAREMESEREVILSHVRDLEATLQQAIPYIQAMQRGPAPQTPGGPNQTAPTLYDDAGNPVQLPPTLSPMQIEALVQARTASMAEEIAAQREADRSVAEAEASIRTFYEKHSIAEGDETDAALVQTVNALNESWSDVDVDITDADALESVFEATQDPYLLTVLQKNPHYFEDEAGMQLARFQAALLKGGTPITQQTVQVPASMVGQSKPPVTEAASVGTVAPGAGQPLDEWQQIVAAKRDQRTAGGKADSPFFEGA